MARLDIIADHFLPGRWTVRSDSPTALAATCDALVQSLQVEGEALAAWALHHDEQAGFAEQAYGEERRELGPRAEVRVVELPRPPRHNVVWTDRVHLVATSALPASGSRLLGLYVGSKGRLVLAVHHPSVTANVAARVGAMPGDGARDWDSGEFVSNCRFVVRYSQDEPDAIELRAPQPMAGAAAEALARLAAIVAPW